MKRNNLVHKHSMKYNRAATHRDKKKDAKRGYKNKHKKDYRKDNPFFFMVKYCVIIRR